MKQTMTMLVALTMTAFAQPAQPGPEGKGRPPGRGPSIERLLEAADTDKDGALSKEEIEAFKAKRKEQPTPEKPEKPAKPQRPAGPPAEKAASANTIMPFTPTIEPVVVPSQRFFVPRYS